MRLFYKNFLAVLFLLGGIQFTGAQDVYIDIPAATIFNRSEYNTVQNVMNTNGNTSWKFFSPAPNIKSNSGNFFKHTALAATSLPTTVLQWQLSSIGGQIAPFRNGDVLPNYKWFSNSYQNWYQPAFGSTFRSGPIAFNFRIPSNEMEVNAFHAGSYNLQLSQDYGPSWFFSGFSPENFNVFIAIPEEIMWLSGTNSKTVAINSLDQFRINGSQFLINLGPMEVGHTVPLNLQVRSDRKEILFKPISGSSKRFDIAVVKLGGNNSKIVTLPLDRNFTNHSTAGGFTVVPGNRTNFEPQLSISSEDFKNYFFEPGTYNFHVILKAESSNGAKNSERDIDVTIVVPQLSEITIPGGNTEVNFIFNTMQQYNSGQTKSIPNQIRVSNNEKFEVYVKSSAKYFYANGMQTNLNASVLEIGAAGNSEKVALSTTSQKILSNSNPTIDKDLNITYTISASSAQSLIPKEKKTYAINVIYSFTAL